jgi:hypothetical protein
MKLKKVSNHLIGDLEKRKLIPRFIEHFPTFWKKLANLTVADFASKPITPPNHISLVFCGYKC